MVSFTLDVCFLFYSTVLSGKISLFYMVLLASNVPLKIHFKRYDLAVSGIYLCLLCTGT